MRLRPLLADVLPDLKLAQPLNHVRPDQQANQQLDAVALKPQDVNRNFTVSGYVFFPKGTYEQVEMLLVDKETGDTQTVTEPWH